MSEWKRLSFIIAYQFSKLHSIISLDLQNSTAFVRCKFWFLKTPGIKFITLFNNLVTLSMLGKHFSRQHFEIFFLTLKLPITTLSPALSSACDFKNHFCKQCGTRSDCSSRSSLIWVHTVCLYAKIGLKSLQEYSADHINRLHFQMQVFLAF